MRLLWRNGRLEICEQFLTDSGDEWLPKVSYVLLELWRIGSFCGSRWCTLGSACRSYCAAFLLGFSDMFSMLVKKGIITSYEKHGFDKLDEVARTCLVSTALVAWIPEALLFAVLHDGRLAKNACEYRALVDEEVAMLDSLPVGVYEILGTLLQHSSSTVLQSTVLSASLSCQSYLHMRVWSVLDSHPWTLCQGEATDRIAELVLMSEPPEEDVASKLWALAQSGMGSDKLAAAIRLLAQTTWTSHTAEKQHASAAQVSKYHPEVTASVLAQRAFMHGVRELLPQDSAPDRRVARLKHQMQKLVRYRPANLGPRQVYFSEMLAKLKTANADKAMNRNTNRYSHEAIMSLHGQYYAELNATAVQRLSERAEHMR
eukprot:6490574-Amphidinium_carterae.1